MTVLVCGFGRCGSSLTLQMLRAGGFPCFGSAAAFEPEDVGIDRDMRELLPRIEGMAAKILDPQRTDSWPDKVNDTRVIWLDRNKKEQAKSQIKMVELMGGFSIHNRRQAIAGMAASFAPDREICMELFARIGAAVHIEKFEDILESPRGAACRIASFLGLLPSQWGIEQIDKMILVVRRRRPKCLSDLSTEMELLDHERKMRWQGLHGREERGQPLAQGGDHGNKSDTAHRAPRETAK